MCGQALHGLSAVLIGSRSGHLSRTTPKTTARRDGWTVEDKLYLCAIKYVSSNRVVGYMVGGESHNTPGQ